MHHGVVNLSQPAPTIFGRNMRGCKKCACSVDLHIRRRDYFHTMGIQSLRAKRMPL